MPNKNKTTAIINYYTVLFYSLTNTLYHKRGQRSWTQRCSDLSLGSSIDRRLGGGEEERIGGGGGKVSGWSFLWR